MPFHYNTIAYKLLEQCVPNLSAPAARFRWLTRALAVRVSVSRAQRAAARNEYMISFMDPRLPLSFAPGRWPRSSQCAPVICAGGVGRPRTAVERLVRAVPHAKLAQSVALKLSPARERD